MGDDENLQNVGTAAHSSEFAMEQIFINYAIEKENEKSCWGWFNYGNLCLQNIYIQQLEIDRHVCDEEENTSHDLEGFYWIIFYKILRKFQ